MEAPAAKAPEKMIRVRCMKDVWWGPTPKTHKLYEVGSILDIPESRFTDFHTLTHEGGMQWRGAFERLDRVAPPKADEAQDDMQKILAQNEELRRQLSILTGNPASAVAPDVKPGKGKKEVI